MPRTFKTWRRVGKASGRDGNHLELMVSIQFEIEQLLEAVST